MSTNSSSRKHQLAWKNVSMEEIKRFFCILIIMGIVRLPEIKLYWSKKEMYSNILIKKNYGKGSFYKNPWTYTFF
jgi:hypothetical protein